MAKPKGAGKALRLTLPGAPIVWHFIPGTPGLFHPEIPTPIDSLGLTVEEAEAIDKNETHLELVDVTPAEEKRANEALAVASGDALGGVRAALKHRETAEERDRIVAAADAARAVKTEPNTEQED